MFLIDGLRLVVFTVVLFAEALLCNVVQLLSMALVPFSRNLVYRINCCVCYTIWYSMQFVAEYLQGYEITFSGDEIPVGENAIVIGNHSGFADFYGMHSMALRRGMLSNCKYIVKKSLTYIPGFGWGMLFSGMIAINRDWTKDKKSVSAAFDNITKNKLPTWLIMYVEGTRITPEKLKQSQEYAKKQNLPILENVLLPRPKGFVSAVQGLRNAHVKYLYDFTFCYATKTTGKLRAPSMVRMHLGKVSPDFRLHVHARRFKLEDLPTDEAGLGKWLQKCYEEKDKILSDFRNSGKVPKAHKEVYWK
eukprot:TRINITY_DN6713_c0_g1_i1.p1 TRINITY_DN6713_c0_g1~~TRINITY_DN6713_c0_g1_i1.p1  ORF type:complete len:312 (+),score=45.58 TRINITY_DN6713_c0_g1_i1:22-936(+)